MSFLAHLRDSLGFDLSTHVPFTKRYRIRCSQCEAACINGIPCHETGCPNGRRDEQEED
jgi:hypothetical protein